MIRSCSDKLRPYLPPALKTLDASLEDYSEVVAAVCRGDNGTCAQSNDDNIVRAPSVCSFLVCNFVISFLSAVEMNIWLFFCLVAIGFCKAHICVIFSPDVSLF